MLNVPLNTLHTHTHTHIFTYTNFIVRIQNVCVTANSLVMRFSVLPKIMECKLFKMIAFIEYSITDTLFEWAAVIDFSKCRRKGGSKKRKVEKKKEREGKGEENI